MNVPSPQRSRNMAAIKSTGTKSEVKLAKALWHLGYRYRKNDKTVFGKPDLTFKKYKLAVFVDSEFFHGKNWETEKHRIKTNIDFWHKKIERNIERDKEVNTFLQENGWTILRFWDKEIMKNIDDCIAEIQKHLSLPPQ
ncbi:very short patch repair endonuclease [Flavobacterium amniphilum]|uniref:very short patch repair endonuclease n=1 Tax=Flavobacterium amniphilum TaxID=1834035 RepID=UPI002029BC29|nr:very short patch repair endonuclease [Flavobacterium amniphilum]MCL9805027.1 very short patch repair endonuclease [Flavobacterium amniphilum]